MPTKRSMLLNIFEKRFIPFLIQNDFGQYPLPKWSETHGMKLAFPFGLMKRKKGKMVEMIKIQLDRRGAPKFVINFGVIPPEGVTIRGKHFSQNDCRVAEALVFCRLYPSRWLGPYGWFSPSFFSFAFNIESKIENMVEDAIKLYPEIENWFKSKVVGPHVRCNERL